MSLELDPSPAQVPDPVGAALARLEAVVGHPVLLIASSWRDGVQMNLDGEAARVAAGLLRPLLDGEAARVGVVLVGEGGTPGFADSLRRLLRASGVPITTFAPDRVCGALALLALLGDPVVTGRSGGVGACDMGLLGPVHAAVDHDMYRLVGDELDRADEARASAIARRLFARRQTALYQAVVASILPDASPTEALCFARLGRELALDARQLTALGLNARDASAEEDAALWALFNTIEEALELRTPPLPRYTANELFDEVEFEMASFKAGAIIRTVTDARLYQMDSGRPHPDTNLLAGEWIEGVEVLG